MSLPSIQDTSFLTNFSFSKSGRRTDIVTPWATDGAKNDDPIFARRRENIILSNIIVFLSWFESEVQLALYLNAKSMKYKFEVNFEIN